MEINAIRHVVAASGNSLCLVDCIAYLQEESQTTASKLLGRLAHQGNSRYPTIVRLWNSTRVQFGRAGRPGAAIHSHQDLCLCVQELYHHCRISRGGSSSSSTRMHVCQTKYKHMQDEFPSAFPSFWGPHAAIWPGLQPIGGDEDVSVPPATPNIKLDPQTPATNGQEDIGVAPSPSQPQPQDLIAAVTKACSTVAGCKQPAFNKCALTVICPRGQVGELADRIGLYTDSNFVRRTSHKVEVWRGYIQYKCQFGRKPTDLKKTDVPSDGCGDAQHPPQHTTGSAAPSGNVDTDTSQVSGSLYTGPFL